MARLAMLALLAGPMLGGAMLAEPVLAEPVLAEPMLGERGPLLIQAEAQTAAPACDGRDVQVEGNHNLLRLYGACRSLVLKGVANEVSLGLAARGAIRVEGSGNRVFYHAPDVPGLVVLGPDNVVAIVAMVPAPAVRTLPEASATTLMPANHDISGAVQTFPAPPTTTLELHGDDQARSVDCTGRDVAIVGHRGLYLLRGGCRSVTVHGDLLSVQAELAPDAAVTVTGHGVRVGWVLARQGRPPAVSVHGKANRVEPLPHASSLSG